MDLAVDLPMKLPVDLASIAIALWTDRDDLAKMSP